MQLRQLLFLKAAGATGRAVEDTATGNPVTFLTDLARPLKSCLATWQPKQSGTGDPSPENVRPISGRTGVTVWHTGKNLLNLDRTEGNAGAYASSTKRVLDYGKYYLGLAGSNYYQTTYITSCSVNKDAGTVKLTSTSASYGVGMPIPCKAGSSVYIHAVCSDENSSAYLRYNFFKADGTYLISGSIAQSGGEFNMAIVIPDEAVTMCIIFTSPVDTERTYSDICISVSDAETNGQYFPFSGLTSYSVAFPATGKNLLTGTPYGGVFFNVEAGTDFAKTTTHATYTESGNEITVTTDSNWYGCVFATGMLSPGTYNIHTETSEANCRLSAYVTDADLIVKERKSITANNISVTLTESARIVVIITNSSSGSVVATNVQVESGSSYTSWEPYTATVYGGSLDLTTGVLTAEWARKKLSEIITDYQSQWSGRFVGGVSDIALTRFTAEGVVCPCYKSSTTTSNDWIINRDGKNIYMRDTRYETVEALLEAMGDYYVYYVLDTPKTFQLSPTQITALIGNNTMWADADELSVTYLKKG